MFPTNSRLQSQLINAQLDEKSKNKPEPPRDLKGNIDYWSLFQTSEDIPPVSKIDVSKSQTHDKDENLEVNLRYNDFLAALVSNCPKPNAELPKRIVKQNEITDTKKDYNAFRDLGLGTLQQVSNDNRIQAEQNFRNFQTHRPLSEPNT